MNGALDRAQRHKHNWYYPHTVWQGKGKNGVAVVRWCACGAIEMVFADKWSKAPRSHDAREFCQREMNDLKVNLWARRKTL